MKPEAVVSISQRDWSLHRQGQADEARHNDKVKEAIKGNLPGIISDGTIISADPGSKKKVRVPLRSLDLPHIVHGKNKKGVGTGDGSEKIGDVIGVAPSEGTGGGRGAGNAPGEDFYEAEFTIEEIDELVFANLGLPYLQPRRISQIEDEALTYTDIRKNRSPNNLDIIRTAMANLERNARESGVAEIGGVIPEDFRVRSWRKEVKEDQNAVIILNRDASGSMGEFEKYITRSFCRWAVNFLRFKYPRVECVFITHDTEAKQVEEEAFFQKSESGGTRCSSANELTLNLINNKYHPSQHNVYVFHFSDGDNWGDDDKRCVGQVSEMLKAGINQYAYVEIREQRNDGLMRAYKAGVTDPRFEGVYISNKDSIWPALQKIFDPAKQLSPAA